MILDCLPNDERMISKWLLNSHRVFTIKWTKLISKFAILVTYEDADEGLQLIYHNVIPPNNVKKFMLVVIHH